MPAPSTGQTALNRLLTRLDLQPIGPDVFSGGAGQAGATVGDRLFGGLVAAQASVAAARTVSGFQMHSLHALFLRPGRAQRPIRFEVARTKTGRNFQVRTVQAWQEQDCIFQSQVSFARPRKGVEHQDPCPDAPDPLETPNRDQLRGRSNWRSMPLDVRMCDPITDVAALPPDQRVWLRPNGTMPDDTTLHVALVVYASDRTLLDTAWRPHADLGPQTGASLDHSMWFHATPHFDEWHLYSIHSPAAAGGRGLAVGGIYRRDGQRVVTVAQEGTLAPANA